MQSSCLTENREIYSQIFYLQRNRRWMTLSSSESQVLWQMLAWGQPTPPLHLWGLLPVKALQQPGQGWPSQDEATEAGDGLTTAQRLLMTPPASLSWLTGPTSSEENVSPATPGRSLRLFCFLKRKLAMHLSEEWINRDVSSHTQKGLH